MGTSKTKEQLINELAEKHRRIEALETEKNRIVHDFNNILGNIIGYTELALTHYVSPDSPIHECLEESLRAAERGKNLVAKIATLSLQHEKKRQPK
jgi:two-component system, cell cycle sensor histidine kinase and response regulator CckA